MKDEMLKKMSEMSTYREKLTYLNRCLLNVKTTEDKEMILYMIVELKRTGHKE